MILKNLQTERFVAVYRKYGIFFVFVALFIASAAINPIFLNSQNLMNILRQISVVTILACAQTMLIVSGMIDLSAGLVTTMAMVFTAGVLAGTGSVPLAVLTGISVGAGAGFVNGFLVTRYRLPPFIATLAMANVAQGIVLVYTNGQTIGGVGRLRWLGLGNVLGIPVPVILMLLVVALVYALMRFTTLGLHMYAIGGNEKTAVACGINVNGKKRLIFTISGALVGLAGVLLTARLMAGLPNVGTGYEFEAITAVIIGGTSFLGGIGTVLGTLVGAMIVGMINNMLNLLGVPTQYQLIVKGVIIAFAVIIDMKTKSTRSI